MIDAAEFTPQMLQALPPKARVLIEQMQARLARQEALLQRQDMEIEHRDSEIQRKDSEIEHKDSEIQRKEREIKWRDAAMQKLQFELARFKRWQFGAKSEAMTADQRRLFEETSAEDEAELRAKLARLREQAAAAAGVKPKAPRRPRRAALPEHLRRVEHHHEPESTSCANDGCGREMVRIGEDITERLDVVPAEFFVHRHVYGKWACRACQCLKQAPSVPELVEGGMASSGLITHTLISRFVDHVPYYRQKRSMPVPACTHRARRWPPWPARAAQRWSRCTKLTDTSCSAARCCTRTRRRWRCWILALARRAEPTSGPTPGAGTMPSPE